MSNYLTFRSFFNEAAAAETVEVLAQNSIPYKLQKRAKHIDTIIGGDSFDQAIELQIPDNQFENANALLSNAVQIDMQQLGDDYYLFSFTEEELIDIIKKPDEWGAQDVVIARQLLQDKGISYTHEEQEHFKEERLKQLASPEKPGGNLIFAGYILMLLFGFGGILVGYSLWKSKKILPNGQKAFIYTKKAREHGQLIFFLSVALFTFTIVSKLLRQQTMANLWVW
ncbi:MAG: hypothetical protein QM731_06060 [Chitinophagaceae bacterium]